MLRETLNHWYMAVLVVAMCVLALMVLVHPTQQKPGAAADPCVCPPRPAVVYDRARAPKPIPPIRSRDELGAFLNSEPDFHVGAELGVERGEFARVTLAQWTKCTRYVLVDKWDDPAYGDKDYADAFHGLVGQYGAHVVRACRDAAVNCARAHAPATLDYVYVDEMQKDYAHTMAVLHAWWPLVREQGIMAGHDFVEQHEGPTDIGQNWTLSEQDDARVLRGAVVDFFSDMAHPERYRQIYVTYQNHGWWTWIVRK